MSAKKNEKVRPDSAFSGLWKNGRKLKKYAISGDSWVGKVSLNKGTVFEAFFVQHARWVINISSDQLNLTGLLIKTNNKYYIQWNDGTTWTKVGPLPGDSFDKKKSFLSRLFEKKSKAK